MRADGSAAGTLAVPPGLAAKAALGPNWAAWVAGLPRLASEVLAEWELAPDGPPSHGETALVLPVRDAAGRPTRTDGGFDAGGRPQTRPLLLKLSFGEADNAGEAEALKAWRGLGAVRLERADPRRGALLLERLGPADLASVDDLDACAIVGRLYPRLHVPPGPRLPRLAPLVQRWLADLDALGRAAPAPPRFVQQALVAGRALASGRAMASAVVHGDLHYGNVLAGRREPWLVIDPKGYSGDPCYEPAPLLWNRWAEAEASGDAGGVVRERFYAVVDAAGLDERRCRDWVVVRAMIGVSWEVEAARRAGRPLTAAQRSWITRLVTVAKSMQAVAATTD